MRCHPLISPGQRQSAYTVVELLTTVSVLAILTSVAAPGLRNMVESNRAVGTANSLTSALYLARNEAVTRGIPVSICASIDGVNCSEANDWGDGWIVFTDDVTPAGSLDAGAQSDALLQSFPGIEGDAELTGSTGFVAFAANGFLRSDAPTLFELRLPGCSGEHQRDITVNLQGHSSVSAVAC